MAELKQLEKAVVNPIKTWIDTLDGPAKKHLKHIPGLVESGVSELESDDGSAPEAVACFLEAKRKLNSADDPLLFSSEQKYERIFVSSFDEWDVPSTDSMDAITQLIAKAKAAEESESDRPIAK
jgi:hypothetical protein